LTLQQKVPLYNFFIFITLFLFFVTCLVFTINGYLSATLLLGIVVVISGFLFLFYRLKVSIISFNKGSVDAKEEEFNILSESIAEKKKVLKALPLTHKRVSFLFDVSQKLIELVDEDEVFGSFMDTLGELFPQASSILVFNFEKEGDELSLSRSLRRDISIIKEKKGDMLDKWVLRQNSSLIVEDITKDFRFDYQVLKAYQNRGMCSFLVSPFSIGHKMLGVVRVESKAPMKFSFEDSRILRNVCDLTSVVLERSNLFSKARDLVTRDSLTSLFVKDYFYQKATEEIKRARSGSTKVGIIMVDIDDFKVINDTYGHIVGDFILKRLARSLVSVAGGVGNIISRFGGEEFVILAIETDKAKIIALAEDIRKLIECSGLTFRRKRIDFTVSLGIAVYPDDAKDILFLVDKADKLMYKAKKKGKNRVCFSGE